MADIHLAIPPNIVRKTTDDLKQKFPGIRVRPHQTHPEMSDFFANQFGDPEKTADLTLTAYPSALANQIDEADGGIFQAMPHGLPPLKQRLEDIGFGEATPYYKVVAVVTLVIIANKEASPFPLSWKDLSSEKLRDRVVIPPKETPAPALYGYYMNKFFGQEGLGASIAAHKTLLPQEINNAVDKGEYAAGMVFPAFARTFRNNGAKMVWPKEGALTLPLLAFLKKGAPDLAKDVLEHVVGTQYQTFLTKSGLFCSVREDVPEFDELKNKENTLNWMGWPNYCGMADYTPVKP